MLSKFSLIIMAIIFSTCSNVQANELKSTEAQIILDNLKRDISNTLAEIQRLERLKNPELTNLSLKLFEPGYSLINLGVVLEPDTGIVLSVSPHSNAEVLGLKSGDYIKKLLVDGHLVSDWKDGIKLQSGSTIEVEVVRGDANKPLNLKSVATKKDIPSWSLNVSSNSLIDGQALTGCGYVSVFFTPPGSKYQYPAKVFEVDGESGFHLRETIKLPAGQHTLKVHEYIPEQMLPRRKPSIEKAKSLEIMVESDKTYHIAAQFEPEKRLNLADEAYWKPVVWKVSESKCRP